MGLFDVPVSRANFVPVAAQGSSYLRTLKAAIAARDLDILGIGDSIMEGSAGPSAITNRYLDKWLAQLRAKYGVTGGQGYKPIQYGNAPSGGQPWALSSGGLSGGSSFGLGKRFANLNGSRTTATLTVPVGHTDVDIFYTGGPSTGVMTVNPDGAGATSVNTATGHSTVRDYTYRVSGLNPATTHSIVVTWTSGGSVPLTGAMLYNGDTSSGFRLWDGAHYGYLSSDFSNSADVWLLTVNTIQPDLVIVSIGTNDWSGGTNTAAQVKTNLQSIITNVRAQCTVPPSIILAPQYERKASGTPVDTWANYVAAMRSLAAADGDIAVFDMYRRLGTINTTGTNTLSLLNGTDLTHATDKGNQMIADALFDFVQWPVAV